jgi:hypothetical protein
LRDAGTDQERGAKFGWVSRFQAGAVVLFAVLVIVGGLYLLLHRPLVDHMVRSELERDFPGFQIVSLDYYHVDVVSFDAFPYDGYRFKMRHRDYPGLLVAGDYRLSGSGSGTEALRTSIFNGKKMTRGQLRDFATAWSTIAADRPILVGELENMPAIYGEMTTNGASDLERQRIARHFPLGDIRGFPTETDYFWMYLDPKTGKWFPIGNEKQMVAKYGR